MPTYRRKNNPVTTIKLTPEEMKQLWDRIAEDEAKRGRGKTHHTERYSIPLNSKHRPYR